MVVSITFVSQLKSVKAISIGVFDNVVFRVVSIGFEIKLKHRFENVSINSFGIVDF